MPVCAFRRSTRGLSVNALATVFALAILAAVSNARATTTRIWGGNNIGYARQITLALDAQHVYLAEAGLVTVIDRASGTATEVPVRTPDGDYLPVQSAVVHAGVLWLSVGNGTRHSRPRLLVLNGTHMEERARLDARACSLTSSEGEIFFADGVRLRRLGPAGVTTVATAPHGFYFHTVCSMPLAIDHEHIYVPLGDVSTPTAPTPLVAYPRHGGAATTLDRDIGYRIPMLVGRALVLAYTSGTPRSIERFDPATRARSTLVPTATLMMAASDGDALVYIDGNFFAHDRWVVRRLTVSTGTLDTLHEGDVRLAHAIVIDRRGIYALVGAHPDGECVVVYRGIEPGDRSITRCAQPDLQLFAIVPP